MKSLKMRSTAFIQQIDLSFHKIRSTYIDTEQLAYIFLLKNVQNYKAFSYTQTAKRFYLQVIGFWGEGGFHGQPPRKKPLETIFAEVLERNNHGRIYTNLIFFG